MLKIITALLFATVFAIGCSIDNYDETPPVTDAELVQATKDLDTAKKMLQEQLQQKPSAPPNSPAWREYWATRPEVTDALQERVDAAEVRYKEALVEYEKSLVLKGSLQKGISFLEASQMVDQYQKEYDRADFELNSFFDVIEAKDLSQVNTPQEFANIDAKAERLRDAKKAAEDRLRRAIAIRDVLRPSLK